MVALGSSVVSLHRQHAPEAPAVKAGDFPGVSFDMHRFRAVLPDRWMALLHSHFRNAGHVELFFSVDSKTSRDWWHGRTGPAAPFALRAVSAIPGALAALMGEAA